MFATIHDFILYHLTLSAFSNADGGSRLAGSSNDSMRKIVEANPFLREVFSFPHFGEGPPLHVPDVVQNASFPLIYHGSVKADWDNLTLTCRKASLRMDTDIMIESGLDFDKPVYVFARKGPAGDTATLIASDQLYKATHIHDSDHFRLSTLEEILNLPWKKQQVLKRFLSDPSFFFRFFSYVAVQAAESGVYHRDLRTELEAFQRIASEKHSLYDVLVLLDLMQAGTHNFDHWTEHSFFRFLVANGLLNGYGATASSPEAFKLFPLGEIRGLCRYLPFLFHTPDAYREFLDEMLCLASENDAYCAQEFLFCSLCYTHCDASFLQAACKVLFFESITDVDAKRIHLLMDGPNGGALAEFCTAEFNTFAADNQARYHYLLAAVANASAFRAGYKPLAAAVTKAITSHSPTELLLALSQVTLLLWSPSVCGSEITLSEETITEAFMEIVFQHLRVFDPLLYDVAASVAHDMVLLGWLMGSQLDRPGVFETAFQLLRDRTHIRWAEQILMLLPIQESRFCRELRDSYRLRLDEELAADHFVSPEVALGVAASLGAFTKDELETKLIQLTEHFLFYHTEANDEDVQQLKRVQNKILSHIALK